MSSTNAYTHTDELCSYTLRYSLKLSLSLSLLAFANGMCTQSNHVSAITDIVSHKTWMKAEHNWQLRLRWKKKKGVKGENHTKNAMKRENDMFGGITFGFGEGIIQLEWFCFASIRCLDRFICGFYLAMRSFRNTNVLSCGHTYDHTMLFFNAINSFTLLFPISHTLFLCYTLCLCIISVNDSFVWFVCLCVCVFVRSCSLANGWI